MQLIQDEVHPSWLDLIGSAMNTMDATYLSSLHEAEVLPRNGQIFSAFSTPKEKIKTVLIGESPYPRFASANGYAFWDNAVKEIWSESGLSKTVNRATSLRNFIKMLLMTANPSYTAMTPREIQSISKKPYIKHLSELFYNMIDSGFLLLNASLIFTNKKDVTYHSKHWAPFVEHLLPSFISDQPNVTCLLFGNHAKKFDALLPSHVNRIAAEHPYNVSFITNEEVQAFFKPLHLLTRTIQ